LKLKGGAAVLAMTVSPDGKYLITAAGREDNQRKNNRQAVLRLWDLSKGEEAVETPYDPVRLDKIVQTHSKKNAQTHSVGQTHGIENSKPAERKDSQSKDSDLLPVIRSVAFYPQGKSALVTAFAPKSSTYHLGRWTWGNQKPYEKLKITSRPLHDVSMATYTPGNTPSGAIMTVGGSGARKWSLASTDLLEKSFGTKGGINFVRFSPDSQLLVAAGADGSATIWRIDSKTGQWKPAQKLVGQHHGAVRSAVFHPRRSDLLLTASDDESALLWGTKKGTWQPILSLDSMDGRQVHHGPVYQAIFSPDGNKVLTVSADNTAQIWEYNLETGQKSLYGKSLEHGGAEVHCGAFSPDGRWILTGAGDDAWVWDAEPSQPEQPEAVVLVGKLVGHSADVTSVAFSADGTRVLTGSRDFTVKLWDTHGLMDTLAGPQEDRSGDADRFQVLLTLEEHTRQVTSVAFSPNGLDVLTAGLDGQAILWPAVPIGPSISFTDNTIDYTIGTEDKRPLVPGAVLNVPTPMDFTAAVLTVELKDANSSISSPLVHPDDPRISTAWTIKADLRASGMQTYAFAPRPELHAGRQEFQALLRSIAYSYQKPAPTERVPDALAESLSTSRTVTFKLSGIQNPNAKGNRKEIEPISEQVEIRLLDKSDEVIPSAASEKKDSGRHSVAMR
jgi:WD40 repeat protein